MTFKARKEFPNNSPLQLTLIKTRQSFHCTRASAHSYDVAGRKGPPRLQPADRALGDVPKHVIPQAHLGLEV